MRTNLDPQSIKGCNYEFAHKDEAAWRRDLAFGKRIGLNSLRVWLEYDVYVQQPKSYVAFAQHFLRVCHEMGYTVLPILFNANNIRAEDPFYFDEEFKPVAQSYLKAMCGALKKEPALLMYDLLNEPGGNALIWKASDRNIQDYWMDKHWMFVRYVVTCVKKYDPETPVTVGCSHANQLEYIADALDVLSFHCYDGTSTRIRANATLAHAIAQQQGKPVFCTELGSIARGNPYDIALQILGELGIPSYVYGLMVDGYWSNSQGIFYEDGTVRDPAIVAALMGIYRKRDYQTIIPEQPNREHKVSLSIHRLTNMLEDDAEDVFHYRSLSADSLLEVCEELANYLESAQLVAMRIPPTARIDMWRRQDSPNLLEIKDFAYEMLCLLKKTCHIS